MPLKTSAPVEFVTELARIQSRFVASSEKKLFFFQEGGKLFLVEPSGLCYEYKAWAVGKHRQAAKVNRF